jgi:anti-sigma factor RsiW
MTCREAEKLLDLFLDGELEARPMRTVALHVTRCASCEALLQRQERLQDAIAETYAEAVAEVDFTTFWPGVAARMTDRRRPVRTWLSRAREIGGGRAAGLAAAAAITVLGILWVWRVPPAGAPVRTDNQVRIDSLVSESRSVALLSEPESNTTVIWVIDDGAGE